MKVSEKFRKSRMVIVRLTESEYTAVAKAAKRHRSVSDFVREAVASYTKRSSVSRAVVE